jgi:hypothetical protein
MASKRSRVHPKYKTKYKIRNGSAYDRALVRRGDITLWFTQDAIDAWAATTTGKRGAQAKDSYLAIETALTLRLLFNLPRRQTEGLLNSLLSLMGLELRAPDHTTLSRRGRKLNVSLLVRPHRSAIHLFVDSTGLKIFGQGEWAAAKHGGRGKRGWRKLHLGVDESGLIVAVELTDNTTDDVVPELLSQVERDIDRFTADAAYDKWLVYSAVAARDARVVIPPSKTAVVSGGDSGAGQSRDTSVARIGEVGRRQWKKESGYHCQARVENTFYRYKRILGRHLRARDPDRQEVEVRLSCNVLNRLAATGMPESYAIR